MCAATIRQVRRLAKLQLAVAILVILGHQSNGQVGFAPAVNYNVGNRPECIIAADLNGDRKVALICANALDNTVSVLTNFGNGRFTLASTLSVGRGPYVVVAADVNGDGKLDLISANAGDNSLSILTNDGNGGFALSSTVSSGGGGTYGLTAADINGDGKPDLICSCEYAFAVQVLTNDGNGGFALSSTLELGDYPSPVISADVNGDGKMDLICSHIHGLAVWTNNGSGNFTLSSTPGTGWGPFSVVAADLSGHGKTDLVTANFNDNTLSVLTNNGGGEFTAAGTLDVLDQATRMGCPNSVTAADVNGDGRPDLICADLCDGTLMVLTNAGNSCFQLAAILSVAGGPTSVIAADLNGDGKPDLASVNNNGTLSVLIATPTLTVAQSSSGVRVSWPSAWTNWTLLQNPDLTTTNWSATPDILDDGTNKSINIKNPAGKLFFRLSNP